MYFYTTCISIIINLFTIKNIMTKFEYMCMCVYVSTCMCIVMLLIMNKNYNLLIFCIKHCFNYETIIIKSMIISFISFRALQKCNDIFDQDQDIMELKQQHQTSIDSVIKHHVFYILPTGYGKVVSMNFYQFITQS